MPSRSRTCCAGRDLYDAPAVAQRLGVAHYVLAYETRLCAAVHHRDAARAPSDAGAGAALPGLAHYVFDYETRFRDSVIERFADEYARGRTPIPCIACNQGVKFTDLMRLARDLGADCLATGHYVRRIVGPRGPELHRAP